MSSDLSAPQSPTASPVADIDPRGPQFAASLTSVVLIAALVVAPGAATVVLLAAQTVVFAIGAAAGVQRTPYAWLFRHVVRPRLAAPSELEDPAPPRFAQTVGLVFTVVAVVGFAAGLHPLGYVAAACALVAALLNAVFGLCLGCEVFLLYKRATA